MGIMFNEVVGGMCADECAPFIDWLKATTEATKHNGFKREDLVKLSVEPIHDHGERGTEFIGFSLQSSDVMASMERVYFTIDGLEACRQFRDFVVAAVASLERLETP